MARWARLAGVITGAATALAISASGLAGAAPTDLAGGGNPHALATVNAVAKPSHPSRPVSPELASARNAVKALGAREAVLIVHADSTTRFRGLAAVVQQKHGKIRYLLPRLRALSLQVPQDQASSVARTLRSEAGVQSVEVAQVWHALDVPNDPDYSAHQAGYLSAVNAPAAWSIEHASPAVKIAVVDSGVDLSHPDLAGKVVGQYNAVDGTTDVTDAIGHGTFVAGVAAAATNNGVGVAGAGYDTSLLAVKAADANGDFAPDAIANAISWSVTNGARVINLSLGGETDSPTVDQAIDDATAHGVLVVAAAGNYGESDGNGKADPVIYPAGHDTSLAVGATDGSNRASFSEYGSWVDLAAPGVGIYSTTPVGGSSDFAASYDSGDGTSFSAPLVAAAAALLIAQRPDISVADLRAALVNSAHGFGGLGLGTGQVDYRAAFDHLRPATMPTISAPVDGATVSGVVPLTASSSAPTVRFEVDGTSVGNAVAVSGGSAQASWTSWGAANGNHTITALDCSASGNECGSTGSSINVNLSNAAPALTSPSVGSVLTGAFTITATAPGGGVAFYIDGIKQGFDGTAPYSLAFSGSLLADGAHTVKAVDCSAAGTVCNGPASAQINFTTQSLHPTISALSPNPFSPNGDGRNDTTTLTFHLADTENATVKVVDASGATVRGPLGLGTLGAGNHVYTWLGRTNSSVRPADGTYTIVLSTSKVVGGKQLLGSVSRSVRLDTVAPTMTNIIGPAIFYPAVDGFQDTFVPGVTLNEGGLLTLTVRSMTGALVRTISVNKSSGRRTMSWGGLNQSAVRVAAGNYGWNLSIRDSAGNIRSTTVTRYVYVSWKKLVTKTATITKNGSDAYAIGSTASCAYGNTTDSGYAPYGVYLNNQCDPTYGDVALAFYHFTLPSAVLYRTLKLDTYGHGNWGPAHIRGDFVIAADGSDDITSGFTLNDPSAAWRVLGSVNAAGHYNSSHVVTAGIVVTTETQFVSDYDARYVRLTITYAVLQ